MKHLWAVAFVALGSCLTAKAQTADTAQELIALEQSFNQALLRADWKTVERIHADNLVFTNADGSVSKKADLVGSIQSGELKFESIEMSDVKVQDLRNLAVVTGKVVETVRYRSDDLSGTYRFTDVWARRNGGWQIVAGHESRVESISTQHLQQGRWASEDDSIAKEMIQMERNWAEDGCTQKGSVKAFLADDFQGTAPGGERYDKAEALRRDTSHKERDCHLDDAKVRFFGDSVAIIYGSERALRTDKDGKEALRCLVWTDTWLKRPQKWEIVAAQDTAVPCK